MALKILSLKKSEQVHNKAFIVIDGEELIIEEIDKKKIRIKNKLFSWMGDKPTDTYMVDENGQRIYFDRSA